MDDSTRENAFTNCMEIRDQHYNKTKQNKIECIHTYKSTHTYILTHTHTTTEPTNRNMMNNNSLLEPTVAKVYDANALSFDLEHNNVILSYGNLSSTTMITFHCIYCIRCK